jgi:hypothetical protein
LSNQARRTAHAIPHFHHRPAQSEIILAGLKSIAERSVDQEGFVGIIRTRCTVQWGDLAGEILRLRFILRNVSESALLRGLVTLDLLTRPRLQLERPFRRLSRGADLNLPARGLEAEHLHFHRVGSWREIMELVLPGLVRGCQHASGALRGDHRRSRYRLAAELHHTGLRAYGSAEDHERDEYTMH